MTIWIGRVRWLLLAVLAVLVLPMPGSADTLTPSERAWLTAHGPIRYAPHLDAPPFEAWQTNNQAVGIAPDFLAAMAQNLGLQFQQVPLPSWPEAVEAVKKGECDILAVIRPTEERKAFLQFTEPWVNVQNVLFINLDGAVITGLSDLNQRRVAVVRGYAEQAWLREHYPETQAFPVATTREGLLLLAMRHVDALLDSLQVGQHLIAENSLTQIRPLPEILFTTPNHMAVAKTNDLLLGILQKGLDSITPGQRSEILTKWTGQTQPQPFVQIPLWTWQVLAASLAGLAAVSLWVRLLRRQVAQRTHTLERTTCEIRRINRLYATLSQVNQAIVRTQSRDEMFHSLCRVALDYGGFDLAMIWWGELKSDNYQIVVWPDLGMHPTDPTQLDPALLALSREIAMPAYQNNRINTCNDLPKSSPQAPWNEWIQEKGFHSAAAFPIRQNNQVHGVFLLYSVEPAFFNPSEQRLLEEMALDVSFAVDRYQEMERRKRADRALQESREHFRLLFDQAPIGYQSLDSDGNIIDVNATWLEKLGYTRPEVLGRWFGDFLGKRDRDRFRQRFLQFKKEGEALGVTFEMRRKNGAPIWVAIDGRIAHSTEGDFIQTHCVLRDVSEQRKAEATLRESEARYRLISENTGDVIWLFDLQVDHFVYLSPSIAKLLGYTPEETLSRGLEGIFSAESYHRLTDQVAACLMAVEAGAKGPFVKTLQVEQLHKNGTWVPTEVVTTFLPNEGGQIGQLLGVARDIRERLLAEDKLRQSQRDLHQAQAVGHIGSWISELDETGRLEWSAECCRIFGVPPATFSGRLTQFIELVHPEDRDSVRAASQAAQSGRTPYHLEHRIRRPDGTVRWVMEQAELASDAPGKPRRLVGVVQDITERRQLEEQLRQAQKMEAIGQLAGGVAHDFNNLLATLQMQIGIALHDPHLSSEIREGLGEMKSSIQSAASLTRQLLTFSRRQVMQPRPLDLNEVISGMAKMLGRILGEDVDLRLQLHPSPLMLLADGGMLEQMLMNLVVNARDAMPEGGRLVMETAPRTVGQDEAQYMPGLAPGNFACLKISDTGSGISAAHMPHIFEPFFTTKEPGRGTGLGLATVFGIIKQHRGFIKAYSEVGRGTVFVILIPNTEAPLAPREMPAAQAEIPGGTETVLVVEDTPSLRQLMRKLLERAGYRVLTAENGIQALEVWNKAEGKVDLLLTDMVMPEQISGKELAERLTRLKPGLKVIYTSGYNAEFAGRELSLKEGINFLQKPCEPSHLLATIRRVLDH